MSASPTDLCVVALAQIAPAWLDRDSTIAKINEHIDLAARSGARLVVFGEALLPGYPFWIEHSNGAKFESTLQKSFHAHYISQAVDIAAGDLAAVCARAREGRLFVMLGCIERDRERGHSVFCSLVSINDKGDIVNVHRKLMPTFEERLSWSPGDGAGLRTFGVDAFTVGGLNCWENWMPLARAALYAQGEDLHIATWPGNAHNTATMTPFIAREGRSFALSVSGLLRRSDIPDNAPNVDVLRECMPEVCADGGSCIAGPDGEWVVEPCIGEEALLIAELDQARVREERQNFDSFGHYSRPDVLELQVDRRRRRGVNFHDE